MPSAGTPGKKGLLIKIAAVAFLLVVWEAAALLEHAQIILPSPLETLRKLGILLISEDFWSAVGATVLRGLVGFFISFLAGIAVGIASGASSLIRSAVSPLLTVLRATPVMSVILLALIWFAAGWVPVFVAFLMVFPIVCGNVIEGIRSTDRNLLDMARVYLIPQRRVVSGIYLPSIVPYLVAALSTSLGITWKVVIAAEVLSQPLHAVGTGLELAKYRLDTAEVFAWTAVAILLSALSEGALGWAERRIPWRRDSVGY